MGHAQRAQGAPQQPPWAAGLGKSALGRTGEVARNAVSQVRDAVPEGIKKPIRRAGDAVANKAARPGPSQL